MDPNGIGEEEVTKKTVIYCLYCEECTEHDMISERTSQCLACLAKRHSLVLKPLSPCVRYMQGWSHGRREIARRL